MSQAAANGIGRLFRQERNWKGRWALIPVETCYRILEIVGICMTGVGFLTATLALVRLPHVLNVNPVFWIFVGLHFFSLASVILRGLPFNVRFGFLATTIMGSLSITLVGVGFPPTLMFGILLEVTIASLFYGTRGAIGALTAVIGLLSCAAFGWVHGYLPVFLDRANGEKLTEIHTGIVWIRIMLASLGYLTAVVLIMRYVLGDLNSALKSANSTLQQLAVEQEHRARAEEGRITAERSAREAQKFEALGRLASGVAHDFNNALCVMKCWSSYLVEVSEDREVQEAMTDIKRATENAEHLTQHLLAFSRSETSKRDSADISEVVDYECRTLSRLLPKNIVVKCEIDGAASVPLGKGQLQEVILNLAINARDAMPNGGTLTIQSAVQALDVPTKHLKPGKYARLTVSDTGVGMDDATINRIYEPFFTTKGPGKGTGLGLSMVYGLVSRAGGTITAHSRPGEGARFTILLPVISREDSRPVQQPVAITGAARCRTLVVEGKPEIGGLIERILSREGFPVLWVQLGEDAKRAIESSPSPFGLLIVQGVLPGISTPEVVECARANSLETQIVIISAPSIDPTLSEALSTGEFHLLPKPFEPNLLRSVVNEALADRPSGGTIHVLAS